jgi:hypothetical protein
MKNPYGIIPFAVLRMKHDSYDFQGCGMEGMAETCLAASVNLTYSNFLMPYNIGGILIAKNTSFESAKESAEGAVVINGQQVDMNGQKDNAIEVSPDSIISLKESYGGKDASLDFLRLNSSLNVVRDEADWLTKNSLSEAGVDLNAIVLERGYTSGFGIVAESAGLMEMRKEHIPILSRFENELFNIIRIILNNEHSIYEFYPDSVEFSIDYQEPTFPRTVDEIVRERDMKLKLNTISLLDVVKMDNMDITTDDEARQRLKDNYAINKEFGNIVNNYSRLAGEMERTLRE